MTLCSAHRRGRLPQAGPCKRRSSGAGARRLPARPVQRAQRESFPGDTGRRGRAGRGDAAPAQRPRALRVECIAGCTGQPPLTWPTPGPGGPPPPWPGLLRPGLPRLLITIDSRHGTGACFGQSYGPAFHISELRGAVTIACSPRDDICAAVAPDLRGRCRRDTHRARPPTGSGSPVRRVYPREPRLGLLQQLSGAAGPAKSERIVKTAGLPARCHRRI
jgi:hypothetical protein